MGIITAIPNLFIYQPFATLAVLGGVSLIVWVLTSLGSRRSRSKRRVLTLTGGLLSGLLLVLAGFALAFN